MDDSDFGKFPGPAFSGAAGRAHAEARRRGGAAPPTPEADSDPGALFGSMSDLGSAMDSQLGFDAFDAAPAPPVPPAPPVRSRSAEPDLDGIPSGFFDIPSDSAIRGGADDGGSDLQLDHSAFMSGAGRPGDSYSQLPIEDMPSDFFSARKENSQAVELEGEDLDFDLPSVLGVQPDEQALRAEPSESVDIAHADGHLTIPPVAMKIGRPKADTGFAAPIVRQERRPAPPPTPAVARAQSRQRRPSGSHAPVDTAPRAPQPQAVVFPQLPQPPARTPDLPAMLFEERRPTGPVTAVRAADSVLADAVLADTVPPRAHRISESGIRQTTTAALPAMRASAMPPRTAPARGDGPGRPTESGLGWAAPPVAETVKIRPVADDPIEHGTLHGVAAVEADPEMEWDAVADEALSGESRPVSAAPSAPGSAPSRFKRIAPVRG